MTGESNPKSTDTDESQAQSAEPVEDSPPEDEEYTAYVRAKVERGLQQVREGKIISQDEFERRMARWLVD